MQWAVLGLVPLWLHVSYDIEKAWLTLRGIGPSWNKLYEGSFAKLSVADVLGPEIRGRSASVFVEYAFLGLAWWIFRKSRRDRTFLSLFFGL